MSSHKPTAGRVVRSSDPKRAVQLGTKRPAAAAKSSAPTKVAKVSDRRSSTAVPAAKRPAARPVTAAKASGSRPATSSAVAKKTAVARPVAKPSAAAKSKRLAIDFAVPKLKPGEEDLCSEEYSTDGDDAGESLDDFIVDDDEE